MNFLWTTLWFIVAVSILVTVHEFGHFWVARRVGIKVLRFSVGFGKPLLSWLAGKDPVQYAIAPIPLGGYVQLLDEREGAVASEELARAFTRVHPLKRILVLLAGPAINFLFALIVIAALIGCHGITEVAPIVGQVTPGSFAAQAGLARGDRILSINGTRVSEQTTFTLTLLEAIGNGGVARMSVEDSRGEVKQLALRVSSAAERLRLTAPSALYAGLGFEFEGPTHPPIIGKVTPGEAGGRAGLRSGDRVLSVNGRPVTDFESFVTLVRASPAKKVTLRYEREGAQHTVSFVVGSVLQAGKRIGTLGAQSLAEVAYPPEMIHYVRPGPGRALELAAQQVWQLTAVQADLLWRMILGAVSTKNLSGPLTIASYAGQTARAGVAPFFDFLAILSLSLGLINLAPIPVLDGGQVILQALEWAKGSPLSQKAQALSQKIGIALLCAIMGTAIFNDVVQVLHSLW